MPVKGWTCQKEREQAGNESKLLSSMFFKRLPAEGVAQIKGGSSYIRISVLKVDFPTSNDLNKKKNSHMCTQPGCLLVPNVAKLNQK